MGSMRPTPTKEDHGKPTRFGVWTRLSRPRAPGRSTAPTIPPGPPLDQSVDGAWKFGANPSLELADPAGYSIEIELPADWPGPTGSIRLARPIRPGVTGTGRSADSPGTTTSAAWEQATRPRSAGTLCSALGSDSDPTSRAITRRSGGSWHLSRAGSGVRSLRRLDSAHHERPVRR